MSRKINLPSGAELTVNVAPFKDSKALFQAILREWKTVNPGAMASAQGMMAMFSSAFSSVDVEKCLWPCMSRSLYDGEKLTPDVFEKDEARQDFIPACLEVVKDNIVPFTSSLFAGLEIPSETVKENQK
jgi:hypothetical protein